MTRRQNRMILVGLLVSGVFLAGYLGLKAFSENLLYFYTPSDIVEGKAPINKSFRVGGLVETDSLVREGMQVTFMVTDNIKSPGRKIPNRTELIAWVPLTNCILTADFSARKNFAKTSSIFCLCLSTLVGALR